MAKRTHKIANLHAGETRCGRITAGGNLRTTLAWGFVDCKQCRARHIRWWGYDNLPPYEGRPWEAKEDA